MMRRLFLMFTTAIMAFALQGCLQPIDENGMQEADEYVITKTASADKTENNADDAYIAGYEMDEQTQQIIDMLGEDGIYIFEYDANGYNYVKIYAERYEDGVKMSDLNILTMGKADENTDFSGKIALMYNEENMLRTSVSQKAGAIVHTDYKNIGAPIGDNGRMMSWLSMSDKIEMTETSETAILFVGYVGDYKEDGYPAALDPMDELIVNSYEFCYRVMVQYLQGLPE